MLQSFWLTPRTYSRAYSRTVDDLRRLGRYVDDRRRLRRLGDEPNHYAGRRLAGSFIHVA
jgi:hypothetical protein